MRLICTVPTTHTHENPFEFSYYLTAQGIDNECEEVVGEGGQTQYRIWVYEEDQVEKALAFYQNYQDNPTDPVYHAHYEAAIRAQEEKLSQASEETPEKTSQGRPRRRSLLSPAPYGPITIFILLIVITLFIWSQIGRVGLAPPNIKGVIQAPVLAPIERALIYDYPTYFQIRDQLIKEYTAEDIEENLPPSPQASLLIQELKRTPVWMGIYDRFIMHTKNPDYPLKYDGEMFEKIGQGQVWRIFTPSLLHFDLLHIFFNVLWFILLANQIEYRLGKGRYLLLVLLTGILSNTAQYLMSGPFFMGLSGIVCGMAAFIWARQQVAPWEGYLLHRFTLIFLAIFVLGMFALQIVFFLMQTLGDFQLTVGIANTAHLTGAIVGYLLGRLRFFALRHKP